MAHRQPFLEGPGSPPGIPAPCPLHGSPAGPLHRPLFPLCLHPQAGAAAAGDSLLSTLEKVLRQALPLVRQSARLILSLSRWLSLLFDGRGRGREEEEELQGHGEGQGQPSWASRAPAPFTPESCPRPARVPENQRQGGRNPPGAGAPGTQGLEKGEARAQDSCLGLCPSPTPAFHLPVPRPWTDPWPAGAACPRASAAGLALTTIAGRASWSKYFLKCPEQPLSPRLRNNHSSCQLPCSHRGLGRARACGCGSHSRGTGPTCSKPQGPRAGLGTCGCLFPWKPEENPWILTFLSPSCKPTASPLIFVLCRLSSGFVNREGEEEKKSQKEKINSGIRRYTQLFIQQHRVRPAVCQEQWGRGEDDSEPKHVECCDAPAGSRCCGLLL
nr:uncharacterized protein LOC123278977 [Equus asinus]